MSNSRAFRKQDIENESSHPVRLISPKVIQARFNPG